MPAKKTTPKVAAKKAASPAPAKKAPAKKAPAKKVTKVAAKKAAKPAIKKPASYDAIAQAAYLNYRRRMDLGLPGDHDTDWLEAERSVSKG
jgi:hypothetical protein